jgi:hypothetical protein
MVGTIVIIYGLKLGTFDGAKLGTSEGTSLCTSEGGLEGMKETDGIREGVPVGVIDGDMVGLIDPMT